MISEIMEGKYNDAELHDIYYNKYEDFGGDQVTLETFDRLSKGIAVYILCSNIEKAVAKSNSALILRNRFVMKKVDPSGSTKDQVLQ